MKSLFKGAGANILRGVAGAGVLSLYDKIQQVLFGKVYSGGTSIRLFVYQCSNGFVRIRLNNVLGHDCIEFSPYSTISFSSCPYARTYISVVCPSHRQNGPTTIIASGVRLHGCGLNIIQVEENQLVLLRLRKVLIFYYVF